jgi:hypothetical protein
MTPLRLDLTDEHQLEEARAVCPLDEELAAIVSPVRSSTEAAQTVREDEASPSIAKAVQVGSEDAAATERRRPAS